MARAAGGSELLVLMSMAVAVVMLVVAMLVMVMMVLAMTMRMVMVMVMTVVMAMTVVMMAGVAVGMVVRGMRGRIGAAFGIERRLDLDDARAQPPHHFLDDVIPADAQALACDLRRQMAIAEVPGDPHQMHGIGAPDLDQRFGRGHHLDQPAVLQHQRVAAAQGDGVL